MTHSYTLGDIKTSPRGAVKADILENGVVIGRVKKLAGEPWYGVCKFNTERAQDRFCSYADSLSCSEVAEVLYANARGRL